MPRRWRRTWRDRASPSHGLPLRAQRRDHGRLDARDRGGQLRAPRDPSAAGSVQGRLARLERPDLRQGPGQRRRRRRPRPCLVGVLDRLPGAEDGRRQLPVRRFGRPGRRQPASAIAPGSPRWSSASNGTAGPATATADIHASTSTRSPGARPIRRCRPRSIPGWSSIVCSPSGPTTPTASSGIASRASVLDAVLDDARSLNNRLGGADRQKMDQYLSCVRELELRIARADKLPAVQPPAGAVKPQVVPADLLGALPPDVRPDGAGVPGRRDPRAHLHVRPRGERAEVPDGRNLRGPPRADPPPQRASEDRQGPHDQHLPHATIRLPARQAEVDHRKATARCWTTA